MLDIELGICVATRRCGAGRADRGPNAYAQKPPEARVPSFPTRRLKRTPWQSPARRPAGARRRACDDVATAGAWRSPAPDPRAGHQRVPQPPAIPLSLLGRLMPRHEAVESRYQQVHRAADERAANRQSDITGDGAVQSGAQGEPSGSTYGWRRAGSRGEGPVGQIGAGCPRTEAARNASANRCSACAELPVSATEGSPRRTRRRGAGRANQGPEVDAQTSAEMRARTCVLSCLSRRSVVRGGLAGPAPVGQIGGRMPTHRSRQKRDREQVQRACRLRDPRGDARHYR